MNITINQTCIDLTALFTVMLAVVIFILILAFVAILIWRNIRRFQEEINVLSDRGSVDDSNLSIGDDGELFPLESIAQPPKRKKKKRGEIPYVSGCLTQQLLIAFIGLVTAIISVLASTSPLVTIAFQSICNNIVSVQPTPIIGLPSETPTATLRHTYTPVPSPTITLTYTAIPTSTLTESPIPTLTESPTSRPTFTYTASASATVYLSPTPFITATSILLLPQATIQVPTSTSSESQTLRRYLSRIIVPGNSDSGIQIVAEQNGTYEFRYVAGAYSTMATDEEPWRTAVFAYIGNIQWEADTGGLQKLNESTMAFRVADGGSHWDQQSALNAARGRYWTYYLRAGQVLRLVAVDHLGYYGDNPGQIELDMYVWN